MQNNKESIESILEQSKKSKGLGKIFSNLPVGRQGIKNKKLVFLLVPVILIGGSVFAFNKFSTEDGVKVKEAVVYTVLKDDIKITIESDGNIVAKDGVDLSFSDTGIRIDQVYVKEGDSIKKGDKIAKAETDELYIDLQSSQASLESALAKLAELTEGTLEIDLVSYRNAVKTAESSLESTIFENEYNVKEAGRDLEEAENNLKLAEGVDDSQILKNSYESLLNTTFSSLNTLSSALTESDNILGIDNSLANDEFENYLGILDSSFLNKAKSSFTYTKQQINDSELKVVNLNSDSGYEEILAGAEGTKEALIKMQNHLYYMQEMLNATPPVGDLSQSELDSLKSAINSKKSSVISSLTSITSAIQSIDTAENSYETYSNNYEKAKDDLEKTKLDAKISQQSAEISLSNAKNNLIKQTNPPTESELRSAQSNVISAQASVNKNWYQIEEATLTSPIDGEMVFLNGKTGDIVVEEKNEPFCTILNKNVFYVETQIEESDISQIAVDQKAYVTIDALESSVVEGVVSFISLTSENSSGIVTYKVRVLLENTTNLDIREGMSVFIDFVIAESNDVVVVPVASVKNVNGKPSVRLENSDVREVLTGFTDGQIVEIISGLEVGEKIKY